MKRIFIAALFLTLSIAAINGFAQSASREDVLKELQAKRAELQRLEKQFLAPSEEDRAAYAEFLSRPDTDLAVDAAHGLEEFRAAFGVGRSA